jgi:hypothetical protein
VVGQVDRLARRDSQVFQIRLTVDAPGGDSEALKVVSKSAKETLDVQRAILLDHADQIAHLRVLRADRQWESLGN